MHEAVSGTVLSHPIGATIKFTVRVAAGNHGVILRRRLDHATYGQRASVLVDGKPAGIWFTPGANNSKRWADSDLSLSPRLTQSKRQLKIELHVLPSFGAPTGAPVGWTDSIYEARSLSLLGP
jgi:hypothetical protein